MKFEEFGLKKEILDQVNHLGFVETTQIQEKCIPAILEGKDVVGQSLTGSGKTAAFGLPIINQLERGKSAQALVLTPTRELAQQVKENLDLFGKGLGIRAASVYGGVGFGAQIKNIQQSEIIVATPGRLIDHLNRGSFTLKNVKFVVLDEVDRMLDIGFEKDVNRILQQVPEGRQTVMFSATMPTAARQIAHKYLQNPMHVQAELKVDTSLLKQIAYKIPKEKRFSLLLFLLQQKRGTAIVFCRTKRDVDKIAKNLRANKMSVAAVHGDITQNQRQFAVNDFKAGKLDALIATDVAARGLDIRNVTHVYNYEIPQESDDYTHRVGRTARAGSKGDAITFITEHDNYAFDSISRQHHITIEPLPDFPMVAFDKGPGRREFSNERRGFHEHQGSNKNWGSRSNSGRGNWSGNRDSNRGFGRSSDRGPENRSSEDRSMSGYGHSQGPKRRTDSFGEKRQSSFGNRDSSRSYNSQGSERRSYGPSRSGNYSNRGPRSNDSRSTESRGYSSNKEPSRAPSHSPQEKSFADSKNSFKPRSKDTRKPSRAGPRSGKSFGKDKPKKRW